METPAPNQRRKTRATKKTTQRGGSLGESEAEEKTEAQGGDGTNGKGMRESKRERERERVRGEAKGKEGANGREEKEDDRGEYDEGFRGKGGKNPVGARFTTMQLDRAFTSFLFERVSTYRNGVRYSDVERRIVFRTVKWKQKAT